MKPLIPGSDLKGSESKSMREKFIEKKLVDAVWKRGGLCPKLVSPGTNG